MSFILVAIGGFLGSITRYAISIKYNQHLFGTWIANISGSILLAIILKFYLLAVVPDLLWLFLGVGFCGAYTTFSTFGNEILQLIFNKKYRAAFIYLASSLGLSLFLVAIIILL